MKIFTKGICIFLAMVFVLCLAGAPAAEASADATPARPTAPAARVTGAGQIRVTYRQVPRSNRVEIQFRSAGAKAWQSAAVNHKAVAKNTNRNHNLTRLTDERYQIRVRAVRTQRVNGQNRNFRSAWSPICTVRLKPPRPAQPTVTVAARSATVRWNRVAGATGYRVQRRQNTGAWSTVANVGNVTSRGNIALTQGAAYSFRVIALGTGGNNSTASPARTGIRAQSVTVRPAVVLSDFEYTIREGRAEITRYRGSSADAIVPATIQNLPVVVQPTVFNNQTDLRSVTFLEPNPVAYTAFVARVPAVAARAATPGFWQSYVVRTEMYIERWITIGGVRTPVYNHRYIYGQRWVPGTPAVAGRDAVPARPAAGISPNAFNGCLSGLVIYVPADSVGAYQALLRGRTVRSSATLTDFGVRVRTLPTRTRYIVGQTLDARGLVLERRLPNGEVEAVTGGFTCAPTALNRVGTQRIIVTHSGKTAWFDVEVAADSVTGLSVTRPPTKQSYYLGERLDTAGLTLTATYASGRTQVVTSGFTVSHTVLNTGGAQQVTASFGGRSAAFTVTVHTVTGVSIVSQPTRLAYFEGDRLDTAGLSLRVNYSSGRTETITSGFTLSHDVLNTGGTQPITVSFGGRTTTFNVTVTWLEITRIDLLRNPDAAGGHFLVNNIDFKIWTCFVSGMEVRVHYNNGTSKIVHGGASNNLASGGAWVTGLSSWSGTFEVTYTERLGSGKTHSESWTFPISASIIRW